MLRHGFDKLLNRFFRVFAGQSLGDQFHDAVEFGPAIFFRIVGAVRTIAQLRRVAGQTGESGTFHRQIAYKAAVIVLLVHRIGFIEQQIVFIQAKADGIGGFVVFAHFGRDVLIARVLQFLQGFARQGVQFLLGQGRGSNFLLIGNGQRLDVFVIRVESGFQSVGVHIFQGGFPQPAGFIIQIGHQADISAVLLHGHNVVLIIAADHAREAFRRHGFANGRKGQYGRFLRQLFKPHAIARVFLFIQPDQLAFFV